MSSWLKTAPARSNSFNAEKPTVVLLDLGLPPRPASPEEGLSLFPN